VRQLYGPGPAVASPYVPAMRSPGRSGITQIIDDCCDRTRRLTAAIGALPGAEVLHEPQINQGVARFTDPSSGHDSRTDRVIARIQHDGRAWFGANDLRRGTRR